MVFSSFVIRLLRGRKWYWIYEFESTPLGVGSSPTTMHNCMVSNLCNRSSGTTEICIGYIYQWQRCLACCSCHRLGVKRLEQCIIKLYIREPRLAVHQKKISGNMGSYSSILNEGKRTFLELSEYFVTGGRPDM